MGEESQQLSEYDGPRTEREKCVSSPASEGSSAFLCKKLRCGHVAPDPFLLLLLGNDQTVLFLCLLCDILHFTDIRHVMKI